MYGWTYSRFVPKEFKAGNPVIFGNIVGLATYVNGYDIKVCTHTNTIYHSGLSPCDISDIQLGEAIYYYMETD